MTTDPFATAAGIEFKRRFQNMDAYRSNARQLDLFRAFRSGMQYAASQEPTDAEVEAAGRVILACIWNGSEEDAPQDVIAYAWDQARAALSDARAARRDGDR